MFRRHYLQIKFVKKLLTKPYFCAIIYKNLNITKNDGDEDGRNVTFTESCRQVRDNIVYFHLTYPFRVEGPKGASRVDSFRIAALRQRACQSPVSDGILSVI